MPLYEYQCRACGNRFERIQKFSDPPVDVCPNCGEREVEKLLSSPAIQFKGSGWYITDYARKNAGASGDSKQGESSGSKDEKQSKDGKESKDTKKPAESSTGGGSTSTPSTSSDTAKSSS